MSEPVVVLRFENVRTGEVIHTCRDHVDKLVPEKWIWRGCEDGTCWYCQLFSKAPALAEEDAELREVNKALLEACKAALHDLTVPQHQQGQWTVSQLRAAIKLAEAQQ